MIENETLVEYRRVVRKDVIKRKLNQTDQDLEFEVYDGKIKLDKTKMIMKNRVWSGERVRLDNYQSYKIKDTRDTIRKSLSGTILTEMHKIQVKLLLLW